MPETDLGKAAMAADASPIAAPRSSEHDEIMGLTLKAVQLAKSAVMHAIDG